MGLGTGPSLLPRPRTSLPPPAKLVDGVERYAQAAFVREPGRDLFPGQPLSPELPNPLRMKFPDAMVRASTALAFPGL